MGQSGSSAGLGSAPRLSCLRGQHILLAVSVNRAHDRATFHNFRSQHAAHVYDDSLHAVAAACPPHALCPDWLHRPQLPHSGASTLRGQNGKSLPGLQTSLHTLPLTGAFAAVNPLPSLSFRFFKHTCALKTQAVHWRDAVLQVRGPVTAAPEVRSDPTGSRFPCVPWPTGTDSLCLLSILVFFSSFISEWWIYLGLIREDFGQ